jgi:cobyrinic acid a,c-diamide synthase
VSLGLASAWRKKGHHIAAFKKGPDFIDAGWLALASGRPCHNLDPFLMSEDQVLYSLLTHSRDANLTLIEGNRGLFDGLDLEGCCSTAELGKWTQSPVVIIADVTMTTRTIAALIMGCQRFDPALHIVAVVLNRVAGARQENLVRSAIEHYCGIPVVGAIPKLKDHVFPERHMGLVPHQERHHALMAIQWAQTVVEDHVDLDALWDLAHQAMPLDQEKGQGARGTDHQAARHPLRIGLIRDKAFWFYYPENLEQLQEMGAELVEINALTDPTLPDLDALYIGGGFPETQAEALANNAGFRMSLKKRIEEGLPVYAECGGLIYLGECLQIDNRQYPMVNVLAIAFEMDKKPQGHGYTILEVQNENPYFPKGEIVKGHEFHYSRPHIKNMKEIRYAFAVKRGYGLDGPQDGVCKKNLLATYSHIHSAGNRSWAERFIQTARRIRDGKAKKP